jgi:hypothetical protein
MDDFIYGFAFPVVDGWERGDRFEGGRYVRVVTKADFDAHKPSGNRADGSPYWNYVRVRMPVSPGWQVVD